MAKKSKKQDNDLELNSGKAWREGELRELFNLNHISSYQTALMQEWLNVKPVELNPTEQYIFDRVLLKAQKSISGWSEEDLKVKFIGIVLDLGQLLEDDKVVAYFDKTISAVVEGIKLTVKSDFMLAKGILDVFKTPYFHFQEYKPNKNPTGDSMAQLLEAFLIAQVKNKNGNPLYGVEIIGRQWSFIIMEGKDYCTSKAYDAINREDLQMIIAILRKFRSILDTRLYE